MVEWIQGIIEQFGAFGIFLLMLLEDIFPPIPSEIILPLSGVLSKTNDLSPFWAIFAATAGSIAGALFWYYIGLWLGEERTQRFVERHSRWLAFSTKDYQKTKSFFNKHNKKAVFFARMIPAFRTLISIPAGIFKMPMGTFLFYSTLGTIIWNILLFTAGYMLSDQYMKVSHILNNVTNVILGVIIIIYLYRLFLAGLKRHKA